MPCRIHSIPRRDICLLGEKHSSADATLMVLEIWGTVQIDAAAQIFVAILLIQPLRDGTYFTIT